MEQAAAESCNVPPGFRFHPTEEELVGYYLARKVMASSHSHKQTMMDDLDIIQEVDLYRIEPWDLQERCSKYGGGAGGEQQTAEWYFFSYKDRKYPSGTRTNRATAAGFWKATGRDKPVLSSRSSSSRVIGMRKTLVFYKGRAPNGRKTDWIMHEYRLQTNHLLQEEGWVVCRAFQKPTPNQRPSFFPISYATPAGGGGCYHDGYHHHHLPPNARMHVVDGDRHHGRHFLGGYSAHHPAEPEAAANSSFFPPPALQLYSDDDCYLLESKTKQQLLSSSSIPQLESPTTTAIAAACAAAQQRRRGYGGAAAAAQNELMIQGGEDEDAGGAIDWSFLDTLLSTTPAPLLPYSCSDE